MLACIEIPFNVVQVLEVGIVEQFRTHRTIQYDLYADLRLGVLVSTHGVPTTHPRILSNNTHTIPQRYLRRQIIKHIGGRVTKQSTAHPLPFFSARNNITSGVLGVMMTSALDALDVNLGTAGLVSNPALMFANMAMSGDDYVRCTR
jgi:hypothetical protein